MAFTAKQIIDVYLFRWGMQDMTREVLSHLKPMPTFMDSVMRRSQNRYIAKGGTVTIKVTETMTEWK